MNLGQIFNDKTAARDAESFIRELGVQTQFRANRDIDAKAALGASTQFLAGLLGLTYTTGPSNGSAQQDGDTRLGLLASGQADARCQKFLAVLTLAFELAIQPPEMRGEADVDQILSDWDQCRKYWEIGVYAADWLAKRSA